MSILKRSSYILTASFFLLQFKICWHFHQSIEETKGMKPPEINVTSFFAIVTTTGASISDWRLPTFILPTWCCPWKTHHFASLTWGASAFSSTFSAASTPTVERQTSTAKIPVAPPCMMATYTFKPFQPMKTPKWGTRQSKCTQWCLLNSLLYPRWAGSVLLNINKMSNLGGKQGTEIGNCHLMTEVVISHEAVYKKNCPNLLFHFYFSAD